MAGEPRRVARIEGTELPAEWECQWLDEVMDFQGGAQPPASEFHDEPGAGRVRFVQIRDFDTDGHLTFIDDSPKWRKCAKDDVLIARYGASLGRILRGIEGAYNVALVKVLPREKLNRNFAYYLLRSRFFQEPLASLGARSAQSGFNKGDFGVIPVPIPPLREQQAIACILGALDDKIELNRRRNRTLEAMARAIFQSWFVDFDPVKAKIARQHRDDTRADDASRRVNIPRKNPSTGVDGSHALSPALAALFPDRFEDSPLGPIPAGWRVGTVGDVVTLSRDAILPGDYADEVFDHYSIPAYDSGQNPAPESGNTIKSQKFIVTDDCVLVSKLNPKTPRVWIPEVDESRRRIASTEFLVCRPKSSSALGRAYLYCLSCDPTFSEHLTSRASGTSNSHQRVRPQDFLSYEIPLPTAELACAFNDKVDPILLRVLLVKSESRTLAALRDALLPKLISGELRVPDAERIVGRAV